VGEKYITSPPTPLLEERGAVDLYVINNKLINKNN